MFNAMFKTKIEVESRESDMSGGEQARQPSVEDHSSSFLLVAFAGGARGFCAVDL